jgi:hypothetical protein
MKVIDQLMDDKMFCKIRLMLVEFLVDEPYRIRAIKFKGLLWVFTEIIKLLDDFRDVSVQRGISDIDVLIEGSFG